MKKDLETEKQSHSETRKAAEEQKSKLNAEIETLKNTVSQNMLEKRALQAQFEEAMKAQTTRILSLVGILLIPRVQQFFLTKEQYCSLVEDE